MADRLLRHTPSGDLYIWRPEYADRDDFEEVIDVESRVVPDTPAPVRKARGAKAGLSTAPAVDEEQLADEASRGLP